MSQPWFTQPLTKKTAGDGHHVNPTTVATWRQLAASAAAAQPSKSGRFERRWETTIMKSGSHRDRILLKTKMVASDPVSYVSHLDSLVAMVTPAKKRDCATAVDTLRKLFLQLLPKSRTLIPFEQRPFSELQAEEEVKKKKKKKEGGGGGRDRCLALWLFEDTLRRRYDEFLTNLENVVLRDVLESNKKKALGALFDLLQNKPEQRAKLVRILANKVGDPSGKLASHAKHKLLLITHKKHSLVPLFVAEFEQMLYRANIREKAQYFVMCCLNSMHLRRKAGKADDKVPLMLLKIYCSFFSAALDKNKIVKRKMLSAILSGVHRAFPFLRQEEVTEHLQRHLNDLFRLVHTAHTFAQAVQTLMVLFHLSQHHEESRDRFLQCLYRKLGDARLLRKAAQRQSLLLHLLYRALAEDEDLPRLCAFTKRMLQVCLSCSDVPIVCGLLLVLSELQKLHPGMINTKQLSAKVVGLDADDGEEYFPDIDSDEEEDKKAPTKPPTTTPPAKLSNYDPSARNPRYCGAETECTWELLQLSNNFFHPSVRVFATAILSGSPIDYSGDPFEDFTRIHFLDRFLQKKPKKPAASGTSSSSSLPINSAEFRKLGEEAVAPDDRCFFEFAQVQSKRRKGGKEEEDEEDEGSVDDADFDRYLDEHEEEVDAELNDVPVDLDSDEDVEFSMSEDDEEDELEDLEDLEDLKDVEDGSLQQEDEEAWDRSDDDDEDDDDDDEGEDHDGMMEVDEEEDSDDDMPGAGKGMNFAFADPEESHKERKQRQWEERRNQWTQGRGGRGNFQRGRGNFGRGRGSFGRGRGSFERGRGNSGRGRGNFGRGRGSFQRGRGDFHNKNGSGGGRRPFGRGRDRGGKAMLGRGHKFSRPGRE